MKFLSKELLIMKFLILFTLICVLALSINYMLFWVEVFGCSFVGSAIFGLDAGYACDMSLVYADVIALFDRAGI